MFTYALAECIAFNSTLCYFGPRKLHVYDRLYTKLSHGPKKLLYM